ncbi:MAG: amidohydrolase [Rhodospirillales bacterium]|nr:amidohydrolase [Rhodospirillales bacterium]
MRKVDAFNHIFPKVYWDKMLEVAGDHKDMGKRVRSVPMLMDLDERFRVMDMFEDYEQILSLGAPPIEVLAGPDIAVELAKTANDGMVELCQKHPDRFPGFVASLPMNNPEEAVKEVNRSVKDLGALGVQIYTNVAGRALDNPEYFQIFQAAHDLDVPMWLHPARGAEMPDYIDEKTSKYEIWWTLGWPYETSVAQARMVFSGMMDKLPNLKVITHHLGGMMPYFPGRTGPGWQFLGARTSDEDYTGILKSLKKPHAEYFKDFYADTALFGADDATELGIKYYGIEKILFASDAPFDPEKGPMYIRETIRILDSLDLSEEDREAIYWKNLAKITKLQ